jgi:hypothetical protein
MVVLSGGQKELLFEPIRYRCRVRKKERAVSFLSIR